MNIEYSTHIIYKGISDWKFIIIKEFSARSHHIEIKILNRPDFISRCGAKKGHAVINAHSLKSCTIVEDNRNITEYLKSHLFPGV